MVKHGDDWHLVAKNAGVKSKLDCISKLIQIPFGNLMVGVADKKNNFLDIVNDDSHSKQAGLASEELQESVKAENLSNELKDNERQNGDAENEGPAPKRLHTELTSDYGSSLMKQVVRISTVDKKSSSYVDLYEYLLSMDQFVNIPLTTNQQTSSGWVMPGWALTSRLLQLRLQLLPLVMKTSVQEKYLMLMMILLTQTHLPGLSKKREHLRLIIQLKVGGTINQVQEVHVFKLKVL